VNPPALVRGRKVKIAAQAFVENHDALHCLELYHMRGGLAKNDGRWTMDDWVKGAKDPFTLVILNEVKDHYTVRRVHSLPKASQVAINAFRPGRSLTLDSSDRRVILHFVQDDTG
jgi:hypothetical protein